MLRGGARQIPPDATPTGASLDSPGTTGVSVPFGWREAFCEFDCWTNSAGKGSSEFKSQIGNSGIAGSDVMSDVSSSRINVLES